MLCSSKKEKVPEPYNLERKLSAVFPKPSLLSSLSLWLPWLITSCAYIVFFKLGCFLPEHIYFQGASLVAQMVKNLPAMGETWFDPWVRKIPWKREWLEDLSYFPT